MLIIYTISVLLVFFGLVSTVRFVFYMPYKKVDVSNLEVSKISEKEAQLYSYYEFYVLSVRYEYKYNGKKYHGSEISYSGVKRFSEERKCDNALKGMESLNSCYVSKKDPEISFLYKKLSVGESSSSGALIASGFLLMLGALYFDFYLVF